MKKLVFFGLALSVLLLADNARAACGDNLVDSRDQKSYSTVQVGNACWMRDNLRFEAGVSNIQKNGFDVFYTWHDAMANSETPGARGICPSGWHIPTEAEWVAAFNVAGNNSCVTINDAWNSYNCPNTSAAIRKLLNITKLTYGNKSYAGVYWEKNTALLWTSTKVTAGSTDYLKHVLIDDKTSGSSSDSVFTDIVRKSWDAGEGYLYNALRCVQDVAVTNNQTVACYTDADQDGYGSQTATARVFDGTTCPSYYAKTKADCNDNNANIKPGATEICNNNTDDNCNGQIDEGCVNNSTATCSGILQDARDGKSYPIVQIGNACWMKDDLRFEAGVSNIQKNGSDVFYTWHDAMANSETPGARGICPSGWHIPTEAEWLTAAKDASGETCQNINDAWGTYYCTKAGSYLKTLLNINKFTIAMRNSSAGPEVTWMQGAAKPWMSTLVRLGDGSGYVKYAYLLNRPNGDNNNYFYTDVTRKSWDDGLGYQYSPVRCIKDYMSMTSSDSNNSSNTSNNNNILTCYLDSDRDGSGSPKFKRQITGANCSAGYVKTDDDCNDSASKINPKAQEVCGNKIDDNCNGQVDEGCTQLICWLDADGDKFGNKNSKKVFSNVNTCPARYVDNAQDCNDSRSAIKPGATEVCDNKIDDNCNGQIDEGCTQLICWLDGDGDKFGNRNSKKVFSNVNTCPARYVDNSQDCNDSRSAIKPGATEVCGNKIDDNCNGQVDEGCKSKTGGN